MELPMLYDPTICESEMRQQATVYVEEALEKGGIVLVNCQVGKNRSGATICSVLLRRRPSKGTASADGEARHLVQELRTLKAQAGFTDALANDALVACAMLAIGVKPLDEASLQQPQARQEAQLLATAPSIVTTSRDDSVDTDAEEFDPLEMVDADAARPVVGASAVST